MPVFAMGKTQELLAQLHFLQKSRRLPETPIYIGGLGRSFCEIYDRLAGRSRRKYPKLNLLDDIAPQVMDGRRARDFSPKKGHIYLISSGMMTEKHPLEHLRAGISRPRPAQHFLRRVLRPRIAGGQIARDEAGATR